MPKIVEGRPWPKDRSQIERSVVALFAQSPSRSYHQADWYKTNIDPSVAESWPRYAGDRRVPEPLGFPFLRKAQLAGLVAVRTTALQELRDANPGAVNGMVTQSLGGKVYACTLPEGVEPCKATVDNEDYEVIAGRIGRGSAKLMSALIVPETSQIVIPEITVNDVRQFDPQPFVPQLSYPWEKVPVL